MYQVTMIKDNVAVVTKYPDVKPLVIADQDEATRIANALEAIEEGKEK